MRSARQACETLLEEALAGGGTDNITIVVGRAVRRER
jgi:serine/threonine protein phosphatase PrpC